MKITVIVPTFNRSWFLKRCLSSLVGQNFSKMWYEILVIDDCSKDDTEKTVGGFMKLYKNIKYIRQEKNQGPGTARNRGLRLAKGSIIAFIDDDCIASKNWLKTIETEFKGSNIVGLEGMTIPTDSVGPFSHYIRNTNGGQYLTCNIAYKGSIIKKIKFDEMYKMANREDSDLAFTLLEMGHKIGFSKKMLVKHIVFDSSFSSKFKRKKAFMYDILLFKKHPELYKKIIKAPFERFTPFYILFSLLCFLNPLFFVILILVALFEIHYRNWVTSIYDFIRFFILQVIGSFIIMFAVLYGFAKFRGKLA